MTLKNSINKTGFSFYIQSQLPSLNEMIEAAKKGTNGFLYARIKKRATRTVSQEASKNVPEGWDSSAPVSVSMTWIERNKRRDPDNISAAVKFVFDGLVKSGIIANDGWEEISRWENHFVVQSPEEYPIVGVIIDVEQVSCNNQSTNRR